MYPEIKRDRSGLYISVFGVRQLYREKGEDDAPIYVRGRVSDYDVHLHGKHYNQRLSIIFTLDDFDNPRYKLFCRAHERNRAILLSNPEEWGYTESREVSLFLPTLQVINHLKRSKKLTLRGTRNKKLFDFDMIIFRNIAYEFPDSGFP